MTSFIKWISHISNKGSPVAGTLLLLTAASSCGTPGPALPANRAEAAATCYAAKVAASTEGEFGADEANEAAHFLFLGAVADGIASPTALQTVATLGNSLRGKIVEAGNAERYSEPCGKEFPQTIAKNFKSLPPESRSTRMMCYTLSTSVLQTYQSSNISPPAATVELNRRLDSDLLTEINAEGGPNIAEVSGFAMRSMAKAVELGPVNNVLRACVSRYNGG